MRLGAIPLKQLYIFVNIDTQVGIAIGKQQGKGRSMARDSSRL